MTKEATRKVRDHKRDGKGHRIVGISLTTVGGFWLAKKLGWLSGAAAYGSGSAIWPVLTIMIGLWFVFSKSRRKARED